MQIHSSFRIWAVGLLQVILCTAAMQSSTNAIFPITQASYGYCCSLTNPNHRFGRMRSASRIIISQQLLINDTLFYLYYFIFLLNTMDTPDILVTGNTWGPTSGLHKMWMPWLWGPAASIAVFLAFFTFRKISIWIHGLFFLFATIMTLVTSIPILTYAGIVPADSTKQYKYPTNILNAHMVIGITCFSVVALVTILGLATQLLKFFNGRSSLLILLKKIHAILGYLILLLCKANSLIIVKDSLFTTLLIIDISSIILAIAWKILFPALEQNRLTHKPKEPHKSILSIKELDNDRDYVVFANYVYDVAPLKRHHPAGFQIIQAVRNKEVDRYIYGSCAADELAEVPLHSHSAQTFSLMNDPVAKIDIPPTFEGFEGSEAECMIPKPKLISKKGNIYQICLFKKEGFPFRFVKYREITQLGRYFSLSINGKTTRLYTTVNFLVDENVQFLRRHLRLTQKVVQYQKQQKYGSDKTTSQGSDDGLSQHLINKNKKLHPSLLQSISCEQQESGRRYQSIPIMFKVYAKGKFTQTMLNGKVKKILISQSKGEGLQLASTMPGRIIMVVGGTGLFPFSDLIDLLYKVELMRDSIGLKREIVELSPILAKSRFEQYSFEMLAAFNSIDDIHEITLQQLLFLSEKGRIKLTLKIKQNTGNEIKPHQNLQLASRSFEDILSDQLDRGNQISRVWICGPPKMNQSVSKLMRDKHKDHGFYLIV